MENYLEEPGTSLVSSPKKGMGEEYLGDSTEGRGEGHRKGLTDGCFLINAGSGLLVECRHLGEE
jgi:hypothetical protein